MGKKLILIDGHSILNRAFYGVPDLTNSEGIHTNAMYGFLNIMFKFLDEEKPDYLTVAFDLSAPTFRHKVFDGYKGTRKPMLPELREQVPLIKEVLKAMNIRIVEREGFEADDLIGTIAKKSAHEGLEVSVISGDRDLLQLAEEHIKIRIPKTKKGVTEVEDYYPKDVYELYGVTPVEFIDLKALMGDSSDNIPGAPGVGPKTASSIMMKYHSLDNVFAHVDELKPPKAQKSIKENMEQVKLSRFLAEINTHVEIDYDIEDAGVDGFFNQQSYELFKRFNFKSLLKRFEGVESKASLDSEMSYQLIDDFSKVEEVFSKCEEVIKDKNKIGMSFAVENKNLIGLSISISKEENYYIPVSGFTTQDYLISKIVDTAHGCVQRQIITINLKKALDIFVKDGEVLVSQESFADAGIGAYLLNPSDSDYEYDSLCSAFLSQSVSSRSELIGKMSIVEAFESNSEALAKMMCLGGFIALDTWEKIAGEIQKEDMMNLYDEIEMPLLFVLFSMEYLGIHVDRKGLSDYSQILGEKISVLEKEIYAEAGEEFNINSPKQLGVILFEKMNMPNGKKTKSGYSTAADVLEKLSTDYPLVKKILEYRQLTKLKSTYADGLAVYIGDDERIHGTFNQTITATGRISSTEPNLQNIPIRMEMGKVIRKVFIPKDGCIFLDADYSQIELRIMAHMSGDEKLIEAYKSAQDIHRITASQVFDIPFDEVTDIQRRNAKAVNFGIIYGISSFGLSQDLSISRKEANEYINHYFETYPQVKHYIDGLVTFAKENGYSKTMFGRRRPIPELKSSNFMQRSFGERVAMNAPIQGTAADIIKLAMVKTYEALKEHNLKSKLILQIHDELLVETYEDEIDEVKQIIADSMKNAASLSVPLEIDMKEGKNWLEAH